MPVSKGTKMGSPTEEIDSSGRKKVKCELCEKFYHRVDVHVVKIHKMAVESYSKKFPDAELMSESAREKEAEDKKAAEAELAPTPGVEPVRGEKPDASKPLRFGSASLFERADLSAEDVIKVPIHDE